MKNAFLIVAFLASIFSSSCQKEKDITILDREQYSQAIMAEEVQLVDVRTPEEYNAGFIKDAINIDYLDQDNFKLAFDKLDKSKPIYVYCQSGGRSQKAAALLADMGFEKIYDLEGGYSNWQP